MLSCVAAAEEQRCVASVDIPGMFLQTDVPEGKDDVHIWLDGTMAEFLIQTSMDCAFEQQRKGARSCM